jgi:hypothetical protein
LRGYFPKLASTEKAGKRASTAARHALGTFPVGNAWALPMACLAVSRAYCMLRAADALRVGSKTGAEYFLS